MGATVVLADIDGAAAERIAEELGGAAEGGRSTSPTPPPSRRSSTTWPTATAPSTTCSTTPASRSAGRYEMTIEHWDRVLDVNLRGVVNGVVAAYPHDRAGPRPHREHLVGRGSPPPFLTAYSTTKFGVVGLSRALREAALHGVKVSVFCPGPVDTPLLDVSGPLGCPRRRRRRSRVGTSWPSSARSRCPPTAWPTHPRARGPQQGDHRRAGGGQDPLVRRPLVPAPRHRRAALHDPPRRPPPLTSTPAVPPAGTRGATFRFCWRNGGRSGQTPMGSADDLLHDLGGAP